MISIADMQEVMAVAAIARSNYFGGQPPPRSRVSADMQEVMAVAAIASASPLIYRRG